jgi:iron complex outermembrane receptor protein
MKICQRAALTALILCPAVSLAQDNNDDDKTADEIVVVGQALKFTSASVEVSREMLVDTAAVLKTIPGANVNSNGVITGIAQYRGMFGDRVAIDIDQLGIISGGPNAMDTPLSYMSPMITEELVVERGIVSVSKAPESIGGYVHTKLARGQFGDQSFGSSGTVGSRYSDNGNVTTTAARLTLADRRHRVSLVTELDSGDNIHTPVGEIRPSGLRRDRYDLSYGYHNGDTNLLLFAGQLQTSDAGTPALPMDIRYIRTDMAGLQISTSLSEATSLQGKFAWNDVEHAMDNYSLRVAPSPMQYRRNLAHGTGGQFEFSGLFGRESGDLRIGIDGIVANHDAVITNPNMGMFFVTNFNAVDRDVQGLFGEWRTEVERSSFEIGVRYKVVNTDAGIVGAAGMPAPMGTNVGLLADAFNSADRSLEWRSVDAVVKYHYAHSDNTVWMVELGSKTRAPSYQELYLWLPLESTGGLADGRTYIGDIGLSEERSNEIVIGVNHEFSKFSISPQIFFRKVGNYIQGIPSTNQLANGVSMMMTGAPALQFANVDAEIWGADLAWKLMINDQWFLDGIASFSRGKRGDISDNLYRLAPPSGSVGVTYATGSWSIRPELVAYARQDNVSAYNGEQVTPGFGLVNLAFAWHTPESWRLEARVDNVFDKTHQDHLAGNNRAMGSDIPVGTRLYGAEKTISAGVIFRF